MSELQRDDREINPTEARQFVNAVSDFKPFFALQPDLTTPMPDSRMQEGEEVLFNTTDTAFFEIDGEAVIVYRNHLITVIGGVSEELRGWAVHTDITLGTPAQVSVLSQYEFAVDQWDNDALEPHYDEKFKIYDPVSEAYVDLDDELTRDLRAAFMIDDDVTRDERQSKLHQQLIASAAETQQLEKLAGIPATAFTKWRFDGIMDLLGRIRPEHQVIMKLE
jgi:hypothetical protein